MSEKERETEFLVEKKTFAAKSCLMQMTNPNWKKYTQSAALTLSRNGTR